MATQTTLTSSKAWAPDQNIFSPADAVPNALILSHSTVGGVIEGDEPALRVAYVDDADAQFTAEGTEIPEADPALNEILVYTGKITQLVRLSREQYLQNGTANQLSDSVARAVTRKADAAFLTQQAPGSGDNAPPAGLVNIADIIEGGPVDNDLDALIDLTAQLEANGATPSGIIVDPIGWASLRKLKTAQDANTTLLGSGTNQAERLLLDLPVTVSAALDENTGVVVDNTAVVSAVGPVNIAVDESVYFTSDSVATRATFRIGWNVVRPDRIGTFTISADTDAGVEG